jgi:hypothetical protein
MEVDMKKKLKRLVCLAIIVTAVIKYMQLDESKKRSIKNMLRQIS